MTVNEAVFGLLKEALSGIDNRDGSSARLLSLSDVSERERFWNNVYEEASVQAVLGITASVVGNHPEIPEGIRRRWTDVRKPYAIRYAQIAAGQAGTCILLQKAGIPVAVMKGMAAAIYYPTPEYRSMGDVDLLVSPENYKAAVKLLKENGYLVQEENKQHREYHSAFIKYTCELKV